MPLRRGGRTSTQSRDPATARPEGSASQRGHQKPTLTAPLAVTPAREAFVIGMLLLLLLVMVMVVVVVVVVLLLLLLLLPLLLRLSMRNLILSL